MGQFSVGVIILVLMWASLMFTVTRVPQIALQIMLTAIGVGVTVYLLRLVPTCRPDPA